MDKLTKGMVFIIGVVVALILGGVFYFLGPYKTNQNLATWKGRLDQAQAIANTRAAKEADLKKAKVEVAEAQALWTKTERTKMPWPPIDLTKTDEPSMTRTMIRLWHEPANTVPLMERFALSPRNVIVQTNFGLPGMPTDPRGIQQNVMEWPLGTVTVRGSFPEILKYMRRWNQAPRLVAVDGFQLQGQSPFLSATANITLYIFPRSNAQAQPAAGAGGVGGFGGGVPGGFGPESGPGGPGGTSGPYGPAGPGVPGQPPGPGGPNTATAGS